MGEGQVVQGCVGHGRVPAGQREEVAFDLKNILPCGHRARGRFSGPVERGR